MIWKYFGTLVNAITVILGGSLGLLLKKFGGEGKLQDLSERIMFCLGLCTIFASVSGLIGITSGAQAIVVVLSMTFGLLIGVFLKIDDRLGGLGNKIAAQSGISKNEINPATGFVTACLLFCTGSMTILGAFESSSNPMNDLILSCHTTLLMKSFLDFVSATCLAATYGLSVVFSAVFVLIFQGLLTLLATFLQPFLTGINAMPIMNCVGSLILISIAMNLTGIKIVKTADFIPAIFLPILFCWILTRIKLF